MSKSVRDKSNQPQPDNDVFGAIVSDAASKVGTRGTIEPTDLFDTIPRVHDSFGTNNVAPSMGEMKFDPSQYEYTKDPNPFGNQSAQDSANQFNQPTEDKWTRGFKIAGANAASAFGQGILSTFDMVGAYNTAKGIVTGSNDDFNSGFMGIFSSEDLNKWSKGVAENNKIYEDNPESTSPGDAGWWANKMLPQLGTMVGTSAAALVTTAAIEGATGGIGTTAAAANLFKSIETAWGAAKSGEIIKGGLDLVKGMKGAAAMFSSIARYSEARFEAQNNFENTYAKLSDPKVLNPLTNQPYTEEEKQHLASAGARVDFGLTMAQLPLDILAMRAMVFNPLAGTATGGLEKGLEHIAESFGTSKIAKAAGWGLTHGIGAGIEGVEAGAIPIFQEEGEHHAMVLAGLDSDKSHWTERVAKTIGTSEFSDMIASGVLGSFLIGPIMNASKSITNARQTSNFNTKYKDYVENVVPYNNVLANSIAKQDATGDHQTATTARKAFNAHQVLDRLHLDNQAGKTDSYDAYVNFLKSTLDQVNSGKTDNINDLFGTPDDKQIDQIKNDYKSYIDDAEKMKSIYNEVGQRYNRNFVPLITMQHFGLNNMLAEHAKADNVINTEKSKFGYFNQLTSQGQQIHEIDYQVQALTAERGRLTEQYRTTTNELEKENINRLIENNKNKLSDTKRQLDEVQKDENYTEQQKETDNDILNSKLHSKPYVQAVYDKENLENSIALQRKNIALWNNPKYAKSKTLEAIPKARTKQQVRNNVEAAIIQDKGKTEPEVLQAAQQKETEIEADNAAEKAPIQQPLGNAELYPMGEYDDLSNIGQIAIKQEIAQPDTVLASLTPNVYDFEKTPEETKLKAKEAVEKILYRLGKDASFEDLVRNFAVARGLDQADKIYEILKYGWKANNKELSEEEDKKIYNKIFGDPFDELKALGSQFIIKNEAELEAATEDTLGQIIADQQEPDGFDTNGQPTYTYKGRVTNEASPKMAFVTRLSELIKNTLEDGTIEVNYEYTSDELNTGDYVESLQLLDPDKFTENSEMEARVPSNYLDIKIPMYLPNGMKGTPMTFGQLISSKNLSPTDQEYKDKIPMILYKKGAKAGEKGVAFVHDIGWYHPLRFNQEKQDDMKNAIANTRSVREEVLNTNGATPITITGKRQTTFAGLVDKANASGENNITLREANPQTRLVIYTNSQYKDSRARDSRLFPNDETKLINDPNKPFTSGQILEIRRYGLEEGKQTFVALPIFRGKIDEAAKTSIYQAMLIYADGKNPAHKQAIDHIKKDMGLDISTTVGIANYMKHFINVFEPEKNGSSKEIEQSAKNQLAPRTPYIAFQQGGNIVFGQAGVTLYVDENKKNTAVAQYVKQGLSNEDALAKATEDARVNSRFVNPSRPDLALRQLGFIKTVTKVNEKEGNKTKETVYPDLLSWYENNLSIDNYPANKPIITIDKNNTTTKAADSYHDYLIDRLKTNIKSYNIGTEEKPNYVTNIQPIITYDTNKNLAAKVSTKEEEVKVEEPIAVPQDTRSEEDKQKIQDILKRAREKLGEDRGSSTDYNMSPSPLDDEQRDSIAQDIDDIAGLDPIEQSVITNFISEEILDRVNFDSGIVTRESIDREIDKLLKDRLSIEKKDNQEQLDLLESLIKLDPTLIETEAGILNDINDYKLRLTKIDNIGNNIEGFKKLAFVRINKKYTGITESKQLIEDDKNTEYEDQEAENPGFRVDVLAESPDKKVTYSLRRFFGKINMYDKLGNEMKGFLNFPLYTDSSEIVKTLQINLKDLSSDFKSRIDKLQTLTYKYPWMQAVINRLTDTKLSEQKKNQFIGATSLTGLKMKSSMLGQNRFTKAWEVKLLDTGLNGISRMLKKSWKNNLTGDARFDLFLLNEKSNYYLNDKKAELLIHKFESWIGLNIKTVQSDLEQIRPIIANVGSKPATISPTGNLLNELRTNIVRKGDRMQFPMINRNFQITSLGNNKYEVANLAKSIPSKEEVTAWLQEFGITLTPKTVEVLLRDGMYHNYGKRSPAELFDTGKTNGLFGILYNKLKALVNFGEEFDFSEYGDSPLNNSVITSLADLESQYNTTEAPFGFWANGKTYFALTTSKFITDRTRELKSKDSNIRRQLGQISYSKDSLWLMLLSDDTYREHQFDLAHDGAETVKQTGKKSYKDRAGIVDMSDMDHEIAKLSKFQPITQGDVIYGKSGSKNYPGTSIPLRMSTMAGLTSSDKSIMADITTAVLNIQDSGLDNDVMKALYEQLVRPDLNRMIKAAKNKATNISGYNEGASLFYTIPEMNNLMYSDNLSLVDAIKNRPNEFDQNFIENNEILKEAINKVIKDHINTLVEEKVKVWDNLGIGKDVLDEKGNILHKNKFMDSKYLNKFKGTTEEKIKLAALDYEVNTLIANANNLMIFAGDPAQYFKSKSTDKIQKLMDTFVNITKRLANQIAPGVPLANSKGEKYIQIFLEDRVSIAENINYLKRLYGEMNSVDFENIKGADAQEYTTWKEHLNILVKLGKTPDFLSDITPDDIDITRKLLTDGKKLTKEQLEIVRKVMQPIKPVYTGQICDPIQDVMRTIYIKSSSFPLIPQLTKGFEIDKLRLKMEAIEKKEKMFVRASYQTANKVGSIDIPKQANGDPDSIWDKETGNIRDSELDRLLENRMILDRENFRIQQEIPYKSDKDKMDLITLGTQIMKLLFGDNVMNAKGFILDGKEYDAKDKIVDGKLVKGLHTLYTEAFIDLINEKQSQLYNELGLDKEGKPIDAIETRAKLQKLLEEEAINRSYPLQSIKGLKLDKDGNFTVPLWSSTNSNRYESMLNSIVSHRMIALKFPGYSLITGSEEGFKSKIKEEGDLTKEEKSSIIHTSIYDKEKGLQGAYVDKEGKFHRAQVFMPSKLRDNNNELVDLLETENGVYKYINDDNGGLSLKEEMFDKELLANFGFRLPSSGHQSGSNVDIAGFLPINTADLIIVPKNFVTQKGLDFDVDKENMYTLWHIINKDGKFEVLSEKHRTNILDKAIRENDKGLQGDITNTVAPVYNQEEIDADPKLKNANSTFNEKLLHNKIIKITRAIYDNPSDEIQSKINKTLGTKDAENQANIIDSLVKANESSKIFSPLSSEYQKQAMLAGASGGIATGAYSLDVVFHAQAQQLADIGTPIELFNIKGKGVDSIKSSKIWAFGNIKSSGVLGQTNTIDGSRSNADVLAERQQIALDNASLAVMGKVNLNDSTLDAEKAFTIQGIDKGDKVDLGNGQILDSIPFLFLSQPIIRDYVAQMKNANSIMADFINNKEEVIVNRLLDKYDPKAENIDDEYWGEQMTNANFVAALSTKTPDGALQGAVLRRFIEMKKYGVAIRGIQTAINFKNNSLGKSFFDVIERKNGLNKLGYDSKIKDGDKVIGTIEGAYRLIGDYKPTEDVEIDSKGNIVVPEGYTNIGDFWVKPTTVVGAFNIKATTTAYNLWNQHFPYDSKTVQDVFDQLLPIVGGVGDISSTRTVELKQDIFKHIKKYLSSSNENGIIGNQDNPNEERKRLYIDTDTNISLPMYLKRLTQIHDNPVINRHIKTNKLLNSLEYKTNKNGQPSTIEYQNGAGEEFDEQFLYESLSKLLQKNGKTGSLELPQIGNKKYTLDTLAQDLIAYSFLGNATQEATQFTKYVAVSYLTAVGYPQWLRKNLESSLGLTANISIPENMKHIVKEFVMQYVQHNPDKVKYKLDDKNWDIKTTETKFEDNKNDLDNLKSFKLLDKTNSTFVAIYNPFRPKNDKQQLYWFDGEKYTRVPTLGTFGMDEYQLGQGIGQSIISGKIKVDVSPQPKINNEGNNDIANDPFNVAGKDLLTVLNNISKSNISGLAELSTAITPFIGSTSIDYATSIAGKTDFNGIYLHNEDAIYIQQNPTVKISYEGKARIILEEVLHSLTVNQIKPYITSHADGTVDVNSNAPSYVTNIVRLYNDVRSKSDQGDLKNMLNRISNKEGITLNELKNTYGLKDIFEFMAHSTGNKEFQKYLSRNEFKQSGQTLIGRFIEVVKDILNKLGAKFDSDTAAAHAINSVFDLIENENKPDVTGKFDKFNNIYTNEDTNNLEKNIPLHSITKIISGGQTGVDMAGLDAALQLGIQTGGTAAARFTQSVGEKDKISNKELATKYGLKEGKLTRREGKFGIYDDVYYQRTIDNAQEADGTIWFGNPLSPGGRLTLGELAQKGKPRPLVRPTSKEEILDWIKKNNIKVLNIAGNREHTNPGIYNIAKNMLVEALGNSTSNSFPNKTLNIQEEKCI